MFNRSLFILIIGMISSPFSNGQQFINYNLYDLAIDHRLQSFNRDIIPFKENSRKGICFNAVGNYGIAWLEGLLFNEGVIELDIKGKDLFQKSFVGIAFHGIDDRTFDAVYFRPFNFLTADSIRKIHAVQYISLPEYDWDKLRKEQNGKYEKSIASPPNPDEWFHAKIVIRFPIIEVYVNNQSKPCLSVNKINNRKSGKIGLWVGDGSDGCFANFRIFYNTTK
jgi:hypothetical protein